MMTKRIAQLLAAVLILAGIPVAAQGELVPTFWDIDPGDGPSFRIGDYSTPITTNVPETSVRYDRRGEWRYVGLHVQVFSLGVGPAAHTDIDGDITHSGASVLRSLDVNTTRWDEPSLIGTVRVGKGVRATRLRQ